MKQHTFQLRDMLNKEVAGIYGVARLTDKARAAHTGKIGNRKYGAGSEQDTTILFFLGISAKVFQEAAVHIDDDVELSTWVLENCKRSPAEVVKFNRQLRYWWESKIPRSGFSKRRRELALQKENRSFFPFFGRYCRKFCRGLSQGFQRYFLRW